MERPKPKELVVRVLNWSDGCVTICAATEDAKRWIEREAPTFGPFVSWSGNTTTIFIDPTYVIDEVVAWLNTYNNR